MACNPQNRNTQRHLANSSAALLIVASWIKVRSAHSAGAGEQALRHAFALILSVWMATLAVRADRDRELTIYFFWAGDCPYCALAPTFLDNAWTEDPRMQIRDFEVENSLANAILFTRVYERIGMGALRAVPLIVVGPHVYVGFDVENGHEILQRIKECRKKGCRDIVRDLIRVPSDLDQAAASFAPPAIRTGKSSLLSVSK